MLGYIYQTYIWQVLSYPLSLDGNMNVNCLIFRRTQYFLWIAQHICTCCHVHLLPVGCFGTTVPEIPLVEEIPHYSPDG